MQDKTFSCGNCDHKFEHSQSVIMHEKNHAGANQFAVIFKIFILSQTSCRLKYFQVTIVIKFMHNKNLRSFMKKIL